MLTLWGRKHGYCDGISRRDFLKVGALGIGGLTLADLLRLKAQGAVSPKASNKAVIIVGLWGGPSHIDMYDMKPNAPEGIRGEFNPIQTNVPGVQICEHLPLQAKIADKLAIIQGLVTPSTDHTAYQIMTGVTTRVTRPAFGTVVSRFHSGSHRRMPPYVSLNPLAFSEEPAYLGTAYRPFTAGAAVETLSLNKAVKPERLSDRNTLLQNLDNLRRGRDANGDLQGWDDFTIKAMDLISSNKVREAFDIAREAQEVKAKYGQFTNLLLALRLAEAGVSVVTTSLVVRSDVGLKTDLGIGSWDTHAENFKHLRLKLPQYDPVVHAMITDLHERGLDKDVAVVFLGEFGRSPKIYDGKSSGNGVAGRAHWPGASSVLIAGGGFRMGQVIGKTDAWGAKPADKRITVQNLLATLYHHLGIDPNQTLPDQTGRPVPLLEDPAKIEELL